MIVERGVSLTEMS